MGLAIIEYSFAWTLLGDILLFWGQGGKRNGTNKDIVPAHLVKRSIRERQNDHHAIQHFYFKVDCSRFFPIPNFESKLSYSLTWQDAEYPSLHEAEWRLFTCRL
jgi:hypothetical protein